MSDRYQRIFTLEEANGLLPALLPLVREMISSRERLLALQPSLAPVLEKMLGNGGGRITAEVLESFDRLRTAVRAIEANGVLIKDMETGLLDFPAERGGDLVFLCWRYGEPSVAHWHATDGGFAGRRPL